MTHSRTLTGSIGVALGVALAVVVAVPAQAATPVGDAIFYDSSDFGQETSSYPDPAVYDWFFGNASGVDGASSWGSLGLTLNSDPGNPGNVQILNQNVTQPVDAASLYDVIANETEVFADTNSGWWMQFAFYGEGTSETEFTTLRPLNPGVSTADPWVTSQAIPGHYAANDTADLADLLDALWDGEAPLFLAYGVWVEAASTATFHAVRFGDHGSGFTPVPTRSISHTELTIEQAETTGFTLSGTGWLPGTGTYLFVTDSNGDDVPVILDPDPSSADGAGNISVHVTFPANMEPGIYEITFDDNYVFYGIGAFGDPFTTIEILAAGLANTGAEIAMESVVAGAAFLLIGTGVLLAVRRQSRIDRSPRAA